MGYGEKKGFPFVAMATMFAMLSGFLLIFLLPYDPILAWSVFLVIETFICLVIVRRLLEARKRVSLSKLNRTG